MTRPDEIKIDRVRRPVLYGNPEATSVPRDPAIMDVAGWRILALLIEGRITVGQAARLNCRRIKEIQAQDRRAAA